MDPKTLADLERLDVFLRAKRDADLDLKDLEQEVWNERRRVTKELMDRGVPYKSLPPEPLPPEWERMMERLDPPVLDPKPPQQGGVPKQPDSKLQGTHVFIRFGAPARVYAELYNIWDRERLGKSRSDTVTKPYFPFARARRDADDPGEVIPPEVMLDIDAFMRWATSRGMVDGLSVEVEGWSNPSWAGREWSDRNRAFASAPDLAHRLDLAGIDEQGQNVWTYDPDTDPDNRESDE